MTDYSAFENLSAILESISVYVDDIVVAFVAVVTAVAVVWTTAIAWRAFKADTNKV